MGKGRTGSMAPDLFAAVSPQETASRSPNPPAKVVQRHVLPSDLPTAIKHLNDQELEQLLAAVTEEQRRRGKTPPVPEKTVSKRVEEVAVSLTPGKLNAVRAAYKAGITLSKIAKQFGIPQSDVRKALSK
jgi:DNA-directed RNA polymerase specialized sigma24 family protein